MQLRKLCAADAPLMKEWLCDPAVTRWLRLDAADAQRVPAFIGQAQDMTVCAHWAVADDDGTYLGTASLKHIDAYAGEAEYALALRRTAQGRGVGRFATDAMLNYAFVERGLRRVYLNVPAEHHRAVALYEKSGFVRMERTDRVWLHGQPYTLLWYEKWREQDDARPREAEKEGDRR